MKPITIEQQNQDKMVEMFSQFIKNYRAQDGTITFKADLKDFLIKEPPKPSIHIAKLASDKIKKLVHAETDEVGFHGLVERDGFNFTITDILVYPQIVTGATVQMDDTEYMLWLHGSGEVPEINKLRFQGHSHVNMTVTPSGVDTNSWDNILQQIPKNDYYIFAIFNKKNDHNFWIYDYKENLIFEPKDIAITTDSDEIDHWYKKQASKIVKQAYNYNKTKTDTKTTKKAPDEMIKRHKLGKPDDYKNYVQTGY